MTRLMWHAVGEKTYEKGVDHGVLYLRDDEGEYVEGFPWNGLTTVTESPSGAESNKQYADNGVYANLKSAEEFGGTIEAFTYPDEFARCDGTQDFDGVMVGQQGRESFGFSYRTLIGNDLTDNAGYKVHLVYGADAAPSERSNTTVNDSPEAATFSWEFTSIPVGVGVIGGTEWKPTSHVYIDSRKVDPAKLEALEAILYGDEGNDPRLPLPAEVITLMTTAVAEVRMTGANAPAYNSGTHVLTLPAVTGVQWFVDGEEATAGAQPALGVGETAVVEAKATTGYNLTGDTDWVYDY